jgi:hypothetical protein
MDLTVNCFLREVGCEEEKWVKLAQEHVLWLAFLLAVLNLKFLCYQ